MSLKTILVKIGNSIWSAIVWIARRIYHGLKAIWNFIKWVGCRFRLWYCRTKAKISRVYLAYSCFMSGVIGFGKSVKSQHKVWKVERQEFLYPNIPAFEHEVLPEE